MPVKVMEGIVNLALELKDKGLGLVGRIDP
jgi:hypothetical protein